MVKIKEDSGDRERQEKLVETHNHVSPSQQLAHTARLGDSKNSHHLTAAWQLLRTESSGLDPISSRQVPRPQKPPSQVSLLLAGSAEGPLTDCVAIKKVMGLNSSTKNSSWAVLPMICYGQVW